MVKINDKSYEFRYSLRSMFVFEEIADKPFEVKSLLDLYIFAYSCIVANPANQPLEFDEFIDACDENPDLMGEFNRFMDEENRKRAVPGKKKVTRKKARS